MAEKDGTNKYNDLSRPQEPF